MIKHLQQDELNNCGQTCVAIVAKVTIAEATAAMHKRGKTSGTDLIRGLKGLKVRCADKTKRQHAGSCYPSYAILRVKGPKIDHWVVIHDWLIYDPASGEVKGPTKYFAERPVTVSSYIELF